MSEFLGIDQATSAVMFEHQLILLHDFIARGILGKAEAIANDFEHEVVGGEREYDHDQTAITGRVHKAVLAVGKVASELAIAFGFALSNSTKHGIKFVDGLVWQNRMNEINRAFNRLEINEKI